MPEPLKVLVVDDDALDRRAARRALRGGDREVQVEEASTCAEALARLSGAAPADVVLLDYQLPDGDGLSLIRRVQALGLDVPLVMLTGHGDERVAVELMKAGAADYLPKAGLTPDSLWRSLRGILRVRRAEAEAGRERGARQAALRQNEERLRFLYDTTSTPDLTFEQKLDRLLEEGCRQFGLEMGTLARVEGERYEVVRSSPAGVALPPGFTCSLGQTFCDQALRQKDAFTIQHAEASEWRDHPAHTALGVEAYLGAVIRCGGRKWGNLAFNSTQAHPTLFTAADREHVRLMAQWIGGELVRRQAEDRLRSHVEREALVNRIGQTLRASLDPDVILETATREVGRAMGVSRCLWANITKAGAFEVAPQQYAAPGVVPLAGTYPQSAYPPEVLARWRAGECVAVDDVDADPHWAFVRPLVASAAPQAFLTCPVLLRGEWIGLFGVHQAAARAWTEGEVALLSAITDMLALAVDNARLYAHERHVADRLQAAFLPDLPDHLRGLDLAKAYRSGLAEAQVGGDLYDAFALDDGRVGLVIADVSGKGLGAAVQTATVKYTLRAFAAEAAAPDLVLRRLNRTLCGEASGLGEHFVTLFYGVYDPATGRLTYASAGHETQLIKRAEGPPTLLHANGPILGIADHVYGKDTEYLRPGDALVLFTDGLTEARAAGTRALLEMEGVTDFVTDLGAGHGAGALAASLERLALDWTGGRPQDDLALLVARRVPAEAPEDDSLEDDDEAPDAEAGGQVAEEFLFGFAFPSSPDYAAEVRQAVAHWMALLGFERAQAEDFQTAVTEAVTNAVRHGSPHGEADTFRVSGYRRPREGFAVEVADSGPGLPAAPNSVMPAPEALGGRGLPLMHALADGLTVLPAEAGLRVRLVKSHPAARPK